MSRENFDTALALVHPDIEFVPPGGQTPLRGAESLRSWMEPDALRDQAVKSLDIVAVADTTILARQHLAARGASSGIELDVHTWSVWALDDDGLIKRIEIYLDHEEDKARASYWSTTGAE